MYLFALVAGPGSEQARDNTITRSHSAVLNSQSAITPLSISSFILTTIQGRARVSVKAALLTMKLKQRDLDAFSRGPCQGDLLVPCRP
jgi:hypothetical protein